MLLQTKMTNTMTKAQHTFEKIAYTPLDLHKDDGAVETQAKDLVNRFVSGNVKGLGYGLAGLTAGAGIGGLTGILARAKQPKDALVGMGMIGGGLGSAYGTIKGSFDSYREGVEQQTGKDPGVLNAAANTAISLPAAFLGAGVAANILRPTQQGRNLAGVIGLATGEAARSAHRPNVQLETN